MGFLHLVNGSTSYFALFVTNMCNVLFHSIAVVLLLLVYYKEERSPAQLLLVNLSMSEFVNNLFHVLISPVLANHIFGHVQLHIEAMFTSMRWINYTNMVFVTLDRLMAILLLLTYQIHCDLTKVKCLMMLTWFMGVAFGTVCTIKHVDLYPLDVYVGISLCVLLTVVALATSAFVWRRFSRTRRRSLVQREEESGAAGAEKAAAKKTTASIFHLFRNSEFYISTLIVSSFVVMTVVPDIIYYLHSILIEKQPSQSLLQAYLFSHSFSYTCNAFICLVLKDNVRNLIWECTTRYFPAIRTLLRRRRQSSMNESMIQREEQSAFV